VIAVLAVIF